MSRVLYYCCRCQGGWRITGLRAGSHLLKRDMRCPGQPRCPGTARRLDSQKKRSWRKGQLRQITAIEFYQATMGFGLPEERHHTANSMEKQLLGGVVGQLELEQLPDNKVVLHSLQINNSTLYFSGSPKGAVVYRIVDHAIE